MLVDLVVLLKMMPTLLACSLMFEYFNWLALSRLNINKVVDHWCRSQSLVYLQLQSLHLSIFDVVFKRVELVLLLVVQVVLVNQVNDLSIPEGKLRVFVVKQNIIFLLRFLERYLALHAGLHLQILVVLLLDDLDLGSLNLQDLLQLLLLRADNLWVLPLAQHFILFSVFTLAPCLH